MIQNENDKRDKYSATEELAKLLKAYHNIQVASILRSTNPTLADKIENSSEPLTEEEILETIDAIRKYTQAESNKKREKQQNEYSENLNRPFQKNNKCLKKQ